MRRWASTSAPRPMARPRSKGTRLESRLTPAPNANQMAAMRVARRGKWPLDQNREQACRVRHRERRQQPRPDSRAERWREHAVGGQVVSGVPGVVPQREADAAEQVAAVARRREVGARRAATLDQPRPSAVIVQAGSRARAARDTP